MKQGEYRTLQFQFILHRRCNQDCVFCVLGGHKQNEKIELTLSKALEILEKQILSGCNEVYFTGGEPTETKFLPELIEYCQKKNVNIKMVTNGQKLGNFKYAEILKNKGLGHVIFSIHSYKPKIHNYLTQTTNSLENAFQGIDNCYRLGMRIDINTVINKLNADHLDKTVRYLVNRFPFIAHFCWNNIDPYGRALENAKKVIARFNDFELSLHKAMEFLSSTGRTFRVERVPLCYLSGFEYASTETRGKIKSTEIYQYNKYFKTPDGFNYINKSFLEYEYSERCNHCFLKNICAGIYFMDKFYFQEEVYPVFISPSDIIRQIETPNNTN